MLAFIGLLGVGAVLGYAWGWTHGEESCLAELETIRSNPGAWIARNERGAA